MPGSVRLRRLTIGGNFDKLVSRTTIGFGCQLHLLQRGPAGLQPMSDQSRWRLRQVAGPIVVVLVLVAELGLAWLVAIGLAAVVYSAILPPLNMQLSSDLARQMFGSLCFIAGLVAVLGVDSWLKITERIANALGPIDRHAGCRHDDPLRTATVTDSPHAGIILRPSWAVACLYTFCMAAGLSCLFAIVSALAPRPEGMGVPIMSGILVVAISASPTIMYLLTASTEWRVGTGGITQYQRGQQSWHVPWVELCRYQVTLGITLWLKSRSRRARTVLPFVPRDEMKKAKQLLNERGIPARSGWQSPI